MSETEAPVEETEETSVEVEVSSGYAVEPGLMTGTVDTTNVGAGRGALLEANTITDFGTTVGEVDGGEDTEGTNPMLRTEDETLELVTAEEEQRAADRAIEDAKREVAEEVLAAEAEVREEVLAEEQVVVGEAEPEEAAGAEGEPAAEEAPVEEPAAEEVVEEELFDPYDYTVVQVQQFVNDNPDEAQAVLDAELAGKNRSTLVDWLNDFIAG